MKKLFLLILGIVLLMSCQKTKRGTVNNFIEAVNNYDVKSVDKLVSKDFVYIDDDTLSNSDFYSVLDSLKAHKVETLILKIEDADSLVKTKEQTRSILDSLLGVKPLLIKEKTYRFVEDRLSSVTVDSTLNDVEHKEELNEKKNAFLFYLKDKYEIEDEADIADELVKYLKEYADLSPSDKKKIYHLWQPTRYLCFQGLSVLSEIDFPWKEDGNDC